ncbi:PHD and RING finger domain-containing protein 1 isoform X2 [Sphaeramia orbicularis]|uniref:PHD and ring finger domains 1 n=1 Tax=Sphaeramia orbicularis TaxID=375764 RepID=A0A673BJB2_9TELE|nr:PHD and RING finger domain-containing protein 1 isoform X2 [Sphaeramia orbicularis]
MDEDDSQDELINCSKSQNKGKRAALWAISDDSDDAEEESGEGESDSGEDEEEGPLDGEEDEEDEEEGNEEDDDEEEEEEEEEDDKAVEGATGGTSADLADMSSDEEADKCPICLNSFNSQPVATPENCVHYFCLDCILEWAKNANLCPIDRINFNNIHLRKCYGGKVQKVITVQKPAKQEQQEVVDVDLEQTSCEVCGGSDREDRLLLCDGCDAGYHMECLTPPLDAVPVEEWFCPECEVNNRQSRGSAEEVSDTESLPSTARPSSSRSQSRFAGPTRAIARTQHSERVRANVNRSRITQARTSQLAPTYLIQSTWLDETINAVVAGLNTAVYVRDFTPRVPTRRRRRQTGKRRKVKSKKTSSAKGKNGKAASTGVKRRKRKMRRTKSKKKLMAKRTVTPRGRIANNLGIVKDKKSSSLPTVYRPSEHTLSSMRADIGAASLSIYGDPFDLDPFVDREEEEQQTHVSSLLQAKRRGISHSAFRSHQPVARPVTASLSRRGVDVPQSGGVVEAAPVPDLLGSILSGQSMLLMDSSDVVINRDGSLKATKPMSLPLSVKPSCSSSSGDISTCVNPVMSPNHADISSSLQCNRNLPGTSESSLERHFSQSSSRFPPLTPSTTSHREPGPHSNLPPRGHPGLQAPHPRGPTLAAGHQGINRARDHRETMSSSSHLTSDSSSKSKGPAPSQSQPKKAPTKPMWVDVSVLPRIPKIKRESSVSADDATSQVGSSGSDRRSSRASSSSSTTSINSYGTRETGINSLAGDKGRQHSVDQQQGRTDGQAQRHRADGAGSSSSFSNSFSSSSSSTGSHSSQPCCSSLSSSSSSVSFRISSSGNSWHSRRLSITSPTTSGGNMQERRKQKEDEARKRQLHRDKQMLLASHTVSKEEDCNTIYDPFNPTVSDSSTSDDEGESKSWESSSRLTTLEGRSPSLGNKEYLVQNNQDSVQVKTEKQESPVSRGELETAAAQETVSRELGFPKEDIKVEQETTFVDTNIETQSALLKNTVKKEPDDADKAESCGHSLKKYLDSDTEETTQLVHHHSRDILKTEKDIKKEESGHNTGTPNTVSSNSWKTPPDSSSASTEKKQKTDAKSESRSKSPSRDSGNIKKTSKKHVSSKEQRTRSSSSETDRCRRGDRTTSTQGGSQKGKDKDRVKSSRRSRSKERRRAHTDSDSSRSNSPDRSSRKRRRSRSRSKNRRRSRSGSSSSSREHSRGRKHKRRSKERYDGRERDHERRRVTKDKRRDRSRSRSRSRDNRRARSRSRSRDNRRGRSRSRSRSRDNRRGRSRSRSRSRDNRRGRSRSKSRSRSRERRKDHITQPSSALSSRDRVESRSREQRRGRSRSSSREKKKEDGSSKSSQKTPGSGISSLKDTKVSKEKKKDKDCPVKEDKIAKTSKREVPSSTSVSKVKKEASDLKTDEQVTKVETVKKLKDVKEIKKEKPPLFDMFEDSPINTPVKKEEVDTPIPSLPECIKEEGTLEDPIKVEASEMKTVKSEPSSPDRCHVNPDLSLSVVTTSSPPSVCTPLTASPLLTDATEQPNTDVLTVPVKQEAQQPSDSDEDFNVDVMLDNLDFVKSESAEGKGASVKQEKEVEEVKNEGEQVLAVVGAKSKTQVKRVTWNIQEPEGPQPEKSASKVALYKLKLKQEGVRRPSSAVPTSTQDISGAVSVSDSPKKAGAGAHIFSSRSDSSHPEELLTTGQGVAEEDVSRKDQYLKKLHMQERAIEEVKLAIKPFYQRRDINKDEYKEILRKAVQKVCHSKSGEINPVKVGNLVKAYVDKYKHARKHKKGEDSGRSEGSQSEAMKTSDSP